jgi:hypothetical protein
MKKYRLVIFTAVLMLIASQAYAFFAITYDYYSDSTFTTLVGEEVDDICNNIFTSTGTTSGWRTRDTMSCNSGQGTHHCQQLVNGSWVDITCPPGV